MDRAHRQNFSDAFPALAPTLPSSVSWRRRSFRSATLSKRARQSEGKTRNHGTSAPSPSHLRSSALAARCRGLSRCFGLDGRRIALAGADVVSQPHANGAAAALAPRRASRVSARCRYRRGRSVLYRGRPSDAAGAGRVSPTSAPCRRRDKAHRRSWSEAGTYNLKAIADPVGSPCAELMVDKPEVCVFCARQQIVPMTTRTW